MVKLYMRVADKITYYSHLLAMDMAKVGGPLSLVKVYMSMLSVKIGYRQVGGLLLVVKFSTQI